MRAGPAPDSHAQDLRRLDGSWATFWSVSHHGDVFLLPALPFNEAPPRRSLGRRAQQRVSRRRAAGGAATECIRALSIAAGSGLPSTLSFDPAVWAPAQRSVLRRIKTATLQGPPARADMVPEAALRSLLRADSLYDSGSAGDVAPYVTGNVSLPIGQRAPVPLLEALEGEALHDVLDPAERTYDARS